MISDNAPQGGVVLLCCFDKEVRNLHRELVHHPRIVLGAIQFAVVFLGG
jgi:hypothetical protein